MEEVEDKAILLPVWTMVEKVDEVLIMDNNKILVVFFFRPMMQHQKFPAARTTSSQVPPGSALRGGFTRKDCPKRPVTPINVLNRLHY